MCIAPGLAGSQLLSSETEQSAQREHGERISGFLFWNAHHLPQEHESQKSGPTHGHGANDEPTKTGKLHFFESSGPGQIPVVKSRRPGDKGRLVSGLGESDDWLMVEEKRD